MKYLILLVICLTTLVACSNIAYYGQAASGQLDLWRRTQPIENLLTDSATPAPLKQQLTEIVKIRTFASKVLQLPDNNSYIGYADLQRPYVVWSVFAAPAFSLTPKKWCFPLLGCVNYRGYFSEADAQKLAEELRQEDYDVYVSGVAAYSTLGWFNDPVLNTMLSWSLPRIAGLIFHELAHQKLYISDDSAFNEAFAMTIQDIGIKRWLANDGTPEQLADYQQSQQREAQFIQLILTHRTRLEAIYQQNLTVAELKLQKTAAYSDLREQYEKLKVSWKGDTRYDRWFAQDLNNAKLVAVATYHQYLPAFQALFIQNKGNLTLFYAEVEKLGELPSEQRQAQLHALINQKPSSD